ncbi:MAG: SufE family protein [Sphingomonadales bacterium]|nr:SufE family protein [Sphingomonadales bacterium]
MTLADIQSDFALLDEWEDRYRYVIELGRTLEPLSQAEHSDANKVRGCASQVWLTTDVDTDDRGDKRLTFRGDSDAHIVRGLIAILFAIYSGRTAKGILATDVQGILGGLGLREHLTPQRSNGLNSMVERIRGDAARALTPADASGAGA